MVCTCSPQCWSYPACTLTTRTGPEDATEHAWGTVESLLAVPQPSDEPVELLSRRLSRPLTIYKALLRLKLVPTPAPLRIHLVGADGREGRGKSATTEAFGPLCALLRGQCPEVQLLLCGPNCAEDDFSSMEMTWGKPASPAPEGTPSLAIEYSTALYHEFAGAPGFEAPHLAAAFNAGVWGYDTWSETVRLLHAAGARACGRAARVHALHRNAPHAHLPRPLSAAGAPLLITSYNADEADADEEALGAMGVAWAWPPCSNPWRSLVAEPRKGDFAPQYENCWTQCCHVGGPA